LITAYVFAARGFGRRITPAPARWATCRTGNSHGKLLSAHAINQAWPGARRVGEEEPGLGFSIRPFQGFPARGSLPACRARVSLSPRHTGRADFPHPAFPDTLAIGMRKEVTARPLAPCLAFWLSWCLRRASFGGRGRVSVVGPSLAQSALPSSYASTYLAGSLRSTGITPLPRYYEPRRLPAGAVRTVMRSSRRWVVYPLRRVSQVPPLIVRRTPSPGTPESSTGASTRYYPVDSRLHHRRQAGRSHLDSRGRSGFT
jgi:hypothetical protein